MATRTEVESVKEHLFLVRKMQHTTRHTPKIDGSYENDAEHSWSVAYACMILAPLLEEELGFELDRTKLYEMALIHDLAEVVTGDTKTWDAENRVNKENQEREAFKELTEGLPDNIKIRMRELWEDCEKKLSIEAIIVKSIDRLDPVIHRTSFGLGWDNVEPDHSSVEALDERQLIRHRFSPTITGLYSLIRDEALSKGLIKSSSE